VNRRDIAIPIAIVLVFGHIAWCAAAPATVSPAGAKTSAHPAAGPPVAARKPVTDHFWGDTVADDYRWLENWNDPAVRSWVDGQNAWTRRTLDALPSRPAILKRAAELNHDLSPHYFDLQRAGGGWCASKDQPPLQQPVLVWLPADANPAKERVLVDPNALDKSGAVSIDFFRPSLDGTKVAVSLSHGGTESGDVHVYDTRTGREVGEVIPRVNGGTAGGAVGWDGDGRGFLYTRYPAKGERPDADLDFYQQVYHHALGTPVAKDTYVTGKDFPKIAEVKLDTSPDGRRQLIEVLNGDGGEHAFWLRQPGGRLVAVAAFRDRAVEGEMGSDALYLLSRRTSLNGSVLRVPYDTPDLTNATAVVPGSEAGIHEFVITEHRIYVHDIVGGPSQVRVFGTDGRSLGMVALPAVCDVSGLAKGAGDDAWLELQSFTEPPHWMHYQGATGKLEPTALVMRSAADFSDIDSRREFAVSKDGTRVPMTILMRRGVKVDGKAPVLLYGYGGYQISMVPDFRPIRRLWLEQGGIWVVANIRGGGEYGDAWHRDGMLLKKQNDYDDFAACAKWLIDHRYTTAEKLACNGASNGGLLMGVMITQQPKTFRAVVSDVGVYDMLRSELSPNGLFNTTEYGSVRDSAQYRALRGYSPLQNVRNGVTYPSILLMTGINDPRVEPYNSFKFAAALQASGTPRPVLLRTSMSTGHIGVPLDARNEKYADMFSFLFDQLGVPYHPVTRAAP